jgi:hypothetical protein
MKIYLAKNRLFQLLVALVAIGFYSVAQADMVNVNVQLQLDSSENMLEVTTRGQCSNNNHNGCIHVRRGTQARINFSLVSNPQCNKPGGVSWEIGEVYLGGKGSESKPGSWGGLDAQVQADFSVADAASGRLNKGSGSNRQSIVISNNNNNAYDIWYKVTAVCVNGSGSTVAVAETDPRIKNGGAD